MEDDLFGDLLGTARPKPSSSSSAGGAKDAPLASLPSGGAPGKQAHLVKPGPPPSKALAPDVFDGGSNGASSAPAAHDDAKPEAVLPAVPGVTKVWILLLPAPACSLRSSCTRLEELAAAREPDLDGAAARSRSP